MQIPPPAMKYIKVCVDNSFYEKQYYWDSPNHMVILMAHLLSPSSTEATYIIRTTTNQ